MIAEDELNGKVLVAEIKREKARIDLNVLRNKFRSLTEATGKWRRATPIFAALSMEDM